MSASLAPLDNSRAARRSVPKGSFIELYRASRSRSPRSQLPRSWFSSRSETWAFSIDDGVVAGRELQARRRSPNEFAIDGDVGSVWFGSKRDGTELSLRLAGRTAVSTGGAGQRELPVAINVRR